MTKESKNQLCNFINAISVLAGALDKAKNLGCEADVSAFIDWHNLEVTAGLFSQELGK